MFLRKVMDAFREERKGKKIFEHMQSIIARRPIAIAVQTHDACNASCVFCARRKIRPSNETMTLELFEKVSEDYSRMGGGHMGFSPLMADPLIDPLFMARLKSLSSYDNITPNIFTNGIAFTRFSDDDIVTLLAAVDHIDISLGGFDRTSYQTMYGVDKFETVWTQLKRLSRLNSSGKTLKVHVRTNRVDTVFRSMRLEELRKLGYRCTDIIDTFSNWGGLVTENDLPEGAKISRVDNASQRVACFSPMYNMMIMQDGNVIACGCMDAREQFQIGDAKKQSLVEIWTSSAMQELRDSFKEGSMPEICCSCAYYMPYEYYYRNKGLLDYRPVQDFWSCLQ